MAKTSRITVRLTVEQVRQLCEVVDTLDVPISQVMRSIVRAYLSDVETFKATNRYGGARSLAAMLDSIGGTLRTMDQKIRTAEAISRNRSEDHRDRVNQHEHRLQTEAVRLYDEFITQGLDEKIALSRTNQVLKTSGFEWTSYEVTKTLLRRAGKFKAMSKSSLSGRPDRAK